MLDDKRRSYTLVCILLLGVSGSALAQSNATFNQKISSAHQYVSGLFTADLNGDGIPDLVEAYSRVTNTFSVQIGKSDGTFAWPVSYKLPVQQQYPDYITTADVNNDGKADVVVAMGNLLSVYFGRGDGTLTAPKNTTLPELVSVGIFAADFNRDGKVDLAIHFPTRIAVVYGDGTGAFTAPATVFSVPADHGVFAIDLGDFDADANADIAFSLTNPPCGPGGCASTDVHILYGNGAGVFTDTTAFPAIPGDFQFTSGDVNADGRTDLVGPADCGTGNMLVLYGQTSRTVASNCLSGGSPAIETLYPGFPVADLNGDGLNDFAVLAINGNNKLVIDVYLQRSGGAFTVEEIVFGDNTFEAGNLVVGDFNRDKKPDLAFAAKNNLVASDQLTRIYSYINTTLNGQWSTCSFPSAAHGIRICSPANGAAVSSSVRITATAAWFEPLRKMELWVDGVKVSEQHREWRQYQWFSFTGSFKAGKHNATIYSAGYDNALQRQAFTFTVQ